MVLLPVMLASMDFRRDADVHRGLIER